MKVVRSLWIVDDNPADRLLARLALEENGCFEQISEVADGEAALALFENFERSRGASTVERLPNLILLDINMPRMDGFELLDRLEQWSASAGFPLDEMPGVLMLTSSDDDRERKRAAACEFVRGFLTKPASAEDIARIPQEFGTDAV